MTPCSAPRTRCSGNNCGTSPSPNGSACRCAKSGACRIVSNGVPANRRFVFWKTNASARLTIFCCCAPPPAKPTAAVAGGQSPCRRRGMSKPPRGDARAYIGLGSNLDDPAAQIRAGMTALARLGGEGRGGVGGQDQPDFVNAVCRVRTGLAPAALMHDLLEIESAQGRVRQGEKGGPRTLDLDLLLYGAEAIHSAALTVPHPRLHERAFVLYPLSELEPDLVIPGHGPLRELLAGCAGQRVQKMDV